jgi:DNA-binding response OmpR family regulator
MCAASRRLVLLADDDESVRTMLTKFLRLRGFDVVAVRGVPEAIDAVLVHRPDAAVVDLRLQRGSGRDVVVAMPPRVPVIIFTAVPEESYELERLRPRTRLIPKPYSLIMLIDHLEEMLARADLLKS